MHHTLIIPGEAKSTQLGSLVLNKATGKRWQRKRNQAWITYCREVAALHRPTAPLDGPLFVAIVYVLRRPISIPKTQKYPWKKNDLDNFGKGLLDAMNGLIWYDDGQICHKEERKRYCTDEEQPKVSIYAEEIA